MSIFTKKIMTIYASPEQIEQYDLLIDNDPYMGDLKNNPEIREVCRAGLWMCEELSQLNCPEQLIVRIQFTAGKLSYNKNPWEIHNSILQDYKNNKLYIDNKKNEILN